MNASFETLVRRFGAYSLHYLIDITDGDSITMHFVNDVKDCTYNDVTYKAGTFSYTPSASEYGFNGGGKLSIAVKDNQIIDLIESSRKVKLIVAGIMDKDGVITELNSFTNDYGKVSVTRSEAVFTFDKDDRLTMTFPTLIWNNLNNRGNS